MKNFYISVFFSLLTSVAFAQYEKCATMPALEKLKQKDPHLSVRMREVEQAAQSWLNNHPEARTRSTASITIPVVVHVVYKNATENIPDSQIVSQIQVLNEDYRRLNTNYSQTRAVFDTVSADTEIEFCLASVDPSGDPTNGITRTLTTTQSFDPILNFDKVKSAATGGKDPWPASDYLNIWVCDMSFFGSVFVLGYAQFPGGDPATDGVVIQYQHFGRVNYPDAAPADLGRTTTHEVGHWLGMRHIWGDDTACDSTDYVGDTPNCGDNSATTCVPTNNTCDDSGSPHWGGNDVPDMIENYMDYSTDECMTMFTKGQKARMWSFINTARTGLATSQGCGIVSGMKNLAERDLNIYPNPANDILNIELGGHLENTFISVHDLLGKEVRNVSAVSSKLFTVNISDLQQGIYFVTVTNGNVKTVKKVVIEK